MSDSFHRSLQAAVERLHTALADECGCDDRAADPIPEADYCTALTLPGRLGDMHNPPEPDEYCDEVAVDDEEYCERHLYLSDSWETF